MGELADGVNDEIAGTEGESGSIAGNYQTRRLARARMREAGEEKEGSDSRSEKGRPGARRFWRAQCLLLLLLERADAANLLDTAAETFFEALIGWVVIDAAFQRGG